MFYIHQQSPPDEYHLRPPSITELERLLLMEAQYDLEETKVMQTVVGVYRNK